MSEQPPKQYSVTSGYEDWKNRLQGFETDDEETTHVYEDPLEDPIFLVYKEGAEKGSEDAAHEVLRDFIKGYPKKAEAYKDLVPGIENILNENRKLWGLGEEGGFYEPIRGKVQTVTYGNVEQPTGVALEKEELEQRIKALENLSWHAKANVEMHIPEQLQDDETSPDQGSQQEPAPPLDSIEVLRRYLGYQDTDLPESAKERVLAQVELSPSANKYAESLVEAAREGGMEAVYEKAREMKEKMLSEAERLAIPVSIYGKSDTWAMWDIGKQYYFYTHTDENSPEYALGNPLESPEKQDEIINRMLGWEAYAGYRTEPRYKKLIDEKDEFIDSRPYFTKQPKGNGTLDSKSLAELGGALRVVEGAFALETASVVGAESVEGREGAPGRPEGGEGGAAEKLGKKAGEIARLEYPGKEKKWGNKTGKEKTWSAALGVGRVIAAAGVVGTGATIGLWGATEFASLFHVNTAALVTAMNGAAVTGLGGFALAGMTAFFYEFLAFTFFKSWRNYGGLGALGGEIFSFLGFKSSGSKPHKPPKAASAASHGGGGH